MSKLKRDTLSIIKDFHLSIYRYTKNIPTKIDRHFIMILFVCLHVTVIHRQGKSLLNFGLYNTIKTPQEFYLQFTTKQFYSTKTTFNSFRRYRKTPKTVHSCENFGLVWFCSISTNNGWLFNSKFFFINILVY